MDGFAFPRKYAIFGFSPTKTLWPIDNKFCVIVNVGKATKCAESDKNRWGRDRSLDRWNTVLAFFHLYFILLCFTFSLTFLSCMVLISRTLDWFRRTMAQRRDLVQRRAFWCLVLTKLRLGVWNPQFFGQNAGIPAELLHSNNFFMVSNWRKFSKDHQRKIGIKESIGDVIYGHRCP